MADVAERICVIESCERRVDVASRGWCKHHYNRWYKYGDANAASMRKVQRHQGTAEERFWAKVHKTDGCWLWTAANNNGYGIFRYGGKNHQAHRLSLQFSGFPLPQGTEVDHLCRNHSCVRPTHLECVDHRTNARRGVAGPTTRARYVNNPYCSHGHPLFGDNLYETTNAKGYTRRMCRTCRTATKRRAYDKIRKKPK